MKKLFFTLLICSQAVSAEVIQMHPDPKITSLEHPYLLHDKAGWDEVRAKVEKYDWAKKAAKGYVEQAEKWNVPGVRNTKDPKRGDWLFITQVEDGLMASGIAYQLTGEKKYAEKVKTFMLRLSDPKNGFPVTRRGCNQASVQEGHFFMHIAMAYDMAIPSGIFTAEDRRQIDDTMRLFIGEERELGSNNISNWCVSMNSGLLFCALVIQDLKVADWILNTPGGVLDQLQRGVLDDGWWYECSVSYNIWCSTMFSQAAIAMRRWGMDLVNAKFPGGYRPKVKPPQEEEYGMSKGRWGPASKEGVSIKRMWDALPAMLDYRGMMFGLNDSTMNEVGGAKMDIAYYLYRDPAYAAVIKRSGSRDLLYGVPELPAGPDLSRASTYADNSGVVVMRSQTENRPQREQIQAVLHYGDHGWYHGHFDRTSLLHLSRYGRSFFNPEMVWYSYPNFMYKFYVQTSVSKNMVVVDQKMQEPVESQKLLFHSGRMMQATAVQTNARWSNPPYGGMVYWDQPHKTFAEKAFAEGRSVQVPENPPAYGAFTDYSEPVLQRRLMILTDDYIVLADWLKAEKEHAYESLFQMKGFQGFDGAMKPVRHTGQWTSNPISSAQFVTDCDWYKAAAPVCGRYEFRFGPGADNAGTKADPSEDGVLKFGLHTIWPLDQEIMIGTVPEVHGSRKVAYTVRSGDKILAEGKTGLWILGAVDVDVPAEGLNSLELLTDQKNPENLFWANARVLTKDGKEIPLTKGSVSKDSKGGSIKIAGVPYEQALPAHLTLDLAGLNAVRFKATFGCDYFVGDESQRRKTVAIRSTGKEARFLTVIEPYEDRALVKSAVASGPDKLKVELNDGRVQEISIGNFEGSGKDISVEITESKDGKTVRSEKRP